MDWHAAAAVLATRQYRREVESSRRLEAAWRERDCELDGEEAEAVEDEPKKYACAQCGEEFTDRFRYSGHANVHRRRAAGAMARPSPPASHRAAANGGPPCPLCCQGLPAEVGVLARQLEAEGLDEEKALKAAVICWAGLRVPA